MKKNKVYFVSDIHLGRKSEKSEIKKEKFIKFCRSIKGKAQKLYLVGDIFEFWFEYRKVIPYECFDVICALHDLVVSGTEVIYIGGNHDFWKGDFLTEKIGIKVQFQPLKVNIGEKRVLIHHGDGFLKSVLDFSIAKKILRNKINIFLYKLIHPDIGIPFAKFVAKILSKKTLKELDLEEVKKKYREKAIEVLSNSEIDVIIMGHTHKRDYYKEGEKIYINLGCWEEKFNYAVFEKEDFKLKEWKK